LTDSSVRPLHIVLLGPPASGKGTQGRRLAESLGLGYLSTGALLREHVETGTPLGRAAEPILARGEYLPDDLICPILAEWLSRQPGGWVLDGFPRSVPQAEFLDQWLEDRNIKLSAAISLEVPFNELITRIRNRVECPDCRWSGQIQQTSSGTRCPDCGALTVPRSDDSEENFRRRHHEFMLLTQPVIGHYRHLKLLSACDATAPQDDVAAELLARFSFHSGD